MGEGSFKRRIVRTSKPDYPVGIDWSNPITKGLVSAIMLSPDGYRDITGNGHDGVVGFSEPDNSIIPNQGRARSFVKANKDEIKSTSGYVSHYAEFTHVMAYASTETIGNTYACSEGTSSGSTIIFGLCWDNNKIRVIFRNSGSNIINQYSAAIDSNDGKPHVMLSRKVGGVSGGGGTFYAHFDGEQVFSVAGPTVASMDVTNATIGYLNRDTLGQHVTGDISLVLRFKRGLTTSEANSITLNPWQVLQPRSQVIPFSTAAEALDGVFQRRILRTNKPYHPVDIDWNNPLSKDILRLYLFNDRAGSTARDTVTGLKSPISRNVYSWSPEGWSQTSEAPTTNSYINTGIATPDACTIHMDVTIQSLYYYVSFFDNIGGDGNHYEMWTSPASNGHVGARANTTDIRCGTNDGVSIGKRYTLTFSWTDGGNIYLYIDGKLRDSQVCPTTGDHGTIAIAGGNDSNDGGTPLYHSFIIYERQLSHAEVRSISNNSYQLLQPRTQIIPFSPAAEAAAFKAYWAANSNIFIGEFTV